jgi:hypothetical protein
VSDFRAAQVVTPYASNHRGPDERFAMDTYETPRLTNYGSIAKLTQAGTSFDGGGGGILNVDVSVGGPGWLNVNVEIFP